MVHLNSVLMEIWKCKHFSMIFQVFFRKCLHIPKMCLAELSIIIIRNVLDKTKNKVRMDVR